MTGNWDSLDNVDLRGKRVLTRVDFNVPMRNGRVTDETRIVRTLPTLETILGNGGIPILMSHLGRPESAGDRRHSLAALTVSIERLSGAPVIFCGQTVGPMAESAVRRAESGNIVLLENLRFDSREQENDPEFAASLASLGDVYCNDAFSVSHRAHASIDRIAGLLPSCAGRLMEAELTALSSALDNPEPPLLAIIGGAKISTKIKLINNLLDKTDILVVSGAMANTFHLAQGMPTGASLAEPDHAETARAILSKAAGYRCELVLPVDSVLAPRLEAGADRFTAPVSECPDDMMILDIGPRSAARIKQLMERVRTLVWNGPPGAFEHPPFDAATVSLAQAAAELTRRGKLLSFAGGGDTAAALNSAAVLDDFTYVSTAGGAFLEWMEGRRLPGITALDRSYSSRRN